MAIQNTAKPTLDTYRDWLQRHMAADPERFEMHYESSIPQLLKAFQESQVWTAILTTLREANSAYQIANKSHLITSSNPPLLVKSYTSFLNKNFRHNVTNNDNWPSPPNDGWWLPPDWIGTLNDIVRTTVVVSYVDGIQFLRDRLAQAIADAGGHSCFDLNAKPDGYYAGHLLVTFPAQIPDLQFGRIEVPFTVEIQITTHVKEAIKSILHPIYEKARIEGANKNWQWDFSCDEFIANNLGHIVHYVEGMIVRVREEQQRLSR